MPMYANKDAEQSGISQRIVHHKHVNQNEKYLETLDDNKVKAGKENAIETILSAVKTHINNINLCKFGCGALGNITINGNYKHAIQMKMITTINSC